MSKSKHIRLRDLKRIYRLIGECRDLGADVHSWFPHLLAGASRIIGVPVVTGGQVEGWSTPRPRGLLILSHGWADEAAQRRFDNWVKGGDFELDFFYTRACRLKRPILTCYRRQLVTDREWYPSLYFNEYRRTNYVDDVMLTSFTRDGDLIHTIALHRGTDERTFGERERLLAHWLSHELGPLLERQLASAREPSAWPLAPRLRQTLDCLLQGDSEKQVARRLRLSQQTVHDYVKALYRHFGVSSRGELLALWIRFCRPRARPQDAADVKGA